jgi:hypothetical protein
MEFQYHHMNRRVVTVILILLALATIPVYWLRLAFTIIPIRDGLYLSTVLASVIAGFFAIYKYGFKHSRRFTLLFLTGALTSMFVSELIFEYHYILDKNNIPFPSIGDFFGLLFYLLFVIGLINEMRLASVNWKHVSKRLLVVAILISIILLGVVGYYGVYQSYDPTVNLFTNLVEMAYGVGDMLLIITSLMLVVLVREYRGGRFAKIWLTLLIAFCFFLAGDITANFYLTQYNNEVWFYKSLLDTLWMIAYLCMAQALFSYGFSIMDAYKLANTEVRKDAKNIELKEVSPEPQEVNK